MKDQNVQVHKCSFCCAFLFSFSSHSFASWLKDNWQDPSVIVIMNNVNECDDCFSCHLFLGVFFQRKKLWHDTTILFFIKDNDSFCIATNISSSRAPSNYRTIIKKRFLHAKTLAAAAASTTTICERAMHACTRPLLERFAKRHSLLFLFFFVLT